MQNEIAIIGAGPAGITCALQLSRYGIRPLLFEKDIPGGLLKNASLVENFPGFPGGISGTGLVRKMAKQLEHAGVPVIHENVTHISFQSGIFRIKTAKSGYTCGTLVIASGTSPVEHPTTHVPYPESRTESPLLRNIFYEVYPIRHVRNAGIAIIGAGDAAFDYAIQMSLNNKVCIFNRSERIRCLHLLFDRVKANPLITYHDNHILHSIQKDLSLSCLKLFFETKNGMESHLADYIIFAIGRKPELSFVDPGFINLFEKLQQERKLYFAGDVRNELFRQASIAAGDGMRTAMQIYFNESNKEDFR
jgi:thioredoxin reductase